MLFMLIAHRKNSIYKFPGYRFEFDGTVKKKSLEVLADIYETQIFFHCRHNILYLLDLIFYRATKPESLVLISLSYELFSYSKDTDFRHAAGMI